MDDGQSAANKAKPTDNVQSQVSSADSWDPVLTVQQVFDDIQNKNAEDPSCWFFTCMIPLQATCYIDKKEIQHMGKQLFAPFIQEGKESSLW